MNGLARLTALAVVSGTTVALATEPLVEMRLYNCDPAAVGPNGTVTFDVEGKVSTGQQGLAGFVFDLIVTGPGAVDHETDIMIVPPVGDIAAYFVETGGLNNPLGFGGTPTALKDALMQVGGAMNTIHNQAPPAPLAWPVGTEIALDTWTVLAEGTISLSDAPEGEYSITLDNRFANVLTDLNTNGAPYYWEVTKATVELVSECMFLVAEPPVILEVKSIIRHGDVEEYGLLIQDADRWRSEPRLPGIGTLGSGKVRVTFETPMDPDTVIPANVNITGVDHYNPGPYPADNITTNLNDDHTVLTIELESALPDRDCYTFDLNGMQSASGVDFASPEDGKFQIVALKGDANRDESVSTPDVSSVKQRLGQPVTENNCQYDVNADNQISTPDLSSIKQRLGNVAPDCPPP